MIEPKYHKLGFIWVPQYPSILPETFKEISFRLRCTRDAPELMDVNPILTRVSPDWFVHEKESIKRDIVLTGFQMLLLDASRLTKDLPGIYVMFVEIEEVLLDRRLFCKIYRVGRKVSE